MSSSPSAACAMKTTNLADTDTDRDPLRRNSTRSQRRVESPRQRIDSILESARARKVEMNSGSDSPKTNCQRENSSAEAGSGWRDTESSADEETHINRWRSGSVNYQSMGSRQTTAMNQPSTASIWRSGRVLDAREEIEELQAGEHQGWWGRFVSDYGTIELENKGSVARDHLALERTFLAWLRTSLAFASIGIAITQLFRLNTTGGGHDPYLHLRQMGKPLGATFLGISIVMLFIGFHRYFESQHWIIRGKFPASRGSIALVAAITFALMITSLVVVVVVEPRGFEKR